MQENLLVARPHQGDEAGDGAHHLLPWHRVALTGHRGVHQVHHATLLLVTTTRPSLTMKLCLLLAALVLVSTLSLGDAGGEDLRHSQLDTTHNIVQTP